MNVIKVDENLYIYKDSIRQVNLEPGKVYSVDYNIRGMFLVEGDTFTRPENFFYEDEQFHDHVLKTFQASKANIGVCLCGYKGQGKSVSAKTLAMRASLPIITINKCIDKSQDVISFLNSIECEYVLLIDEFEKIFKKDGPEQDEHSENIFLSFLDGANMSAYKKLVILTCNQDIGDFFINRPSRIRYYKKYNYISDALYDNLIEELLINKEFAQDLKDNLQKKDATVDLLKSIIEEINIHGKPYSSFKEFYNHRESIATYIRWLWNENQNEFTWESIFETARELTRDNISKEIYEAVVLNSSDNEIVYRTKEYVESSNDEKPGTFVTRVYKICKSSSMSNPYFGKKS